MHEFSEEQKENLLKNQNILKITEKHIVYTATFKIKVVEANLSGSKAVDVFRDHGFAQESFTKEYCRSCLKKWKRKYQEKGKESFCLESRGANPSGRPKKPTYEELEAIVAIQREALGYAKK